MPTFLRVVAARVRGFLRPDELDREFDQELEAHLAMAEEEKIGEGMTPSEARRMARVDLGGLTQLREAGREARGLPWVGASWLDVKLSLRMLRKSWGLTLVAGLAMTVVIGSATVVFDVMNAFGGTTLPLEDGDRVVALQTWDALKRDPRGTWRLDFERWRDELRSVENIGAFRMVERNLFSADGSAEPVSVAEMTASGFQVARVPPVMGRPLVEGDEREDAEPVVVIGHEVWQSRFAADPAVVGQTLRLGDTVRTVVGVMPKDFGFPLYHRFWTPLRAAPSAYLQNDRSKGLVVFGRLAPGVELEHARAEIAALGLLPAISVSGAEEDLEPRIVSYTVAFTGDVDRWMVRLISFLVAMLLVPPCANIAILVYARTITRQAEFAARYALGAGRGHIVSQLFVELLVLALLAGGAALVIARFVLWQLELDIRGRGQVLPFWMDFGLSYKTVIFVGCLSVLAALIAGGVPALQATGRRMQSGLRSLGGHTAVKLGAAWTALIVMQVAFSFAFLPTCVEMAWGTLRSGVLGPGFAAEEFLTARLEMGEETIADTAVGSGLGQFAARFADRRIELVRKLKAEPGISAVSASSTVPGEEPWVRVEIEGVEQAEGSVVEFHRPVRFNRVDQAFFEVFELPILTGRGFEPADFESARDVVIVNRSFVRDALGDGNPLGRRFRYRQSEEGAPSTASGAEGWYEIVGIVADLHANAGLRGVYHPAAAEARPPVSLTLRVDPDASRLAGRLREIATELDPMLRLGQVRYLDSIYRQQAVGNYMGASALIVSTLSVLLLSAAGMYALMSFTVSQRRREIGIRSALGAQPQRLLAGIFGRALGQVAIGATAGVLVALFLSYYLPVSEMGGWEVPGVLPAAALLMVVIGLLAVVGPALRGLRVDPIEELREG